MILRLVLFFSLIANSTWAQVPEGAHTSWQPFARSRLSRFEWQIDPTSNKLNFRRCDCDDVYHVICQRPILSRGMDASDLDLLLQYYIEKLSNAGGHKLNQIVGVMTASLVGMGAYMSTMGLVANVVPQRINKLLFAGSYHIVSVGALVALLGYAWSIETSRYRQYLISRELAEAMKRSREQPPELYITSQSVFEEFAKTFHRTLYEFTHGGTYSPEMNLILQ